MPKKQIKNYDYYELITIIKNAIRISKKHLKKKIVKKEISFVIMQYGFQPRFLSAHYGRQSVLQEIYPYFATQHYATVHPSFRLDNLELVLQVVDNLAPAWKVGTHSHQV